MGDQLVAELYIYIYIYRSKSVVTSEHVDFLPTVAHISFRYFNFLSCKYYVLLETLGSKPLLLKN
jgi:hypothetical protein